MDRVTSLFLLAALCIGYVVSSSVKHDNNILQRDRRDNRRITTTVTPAPFNCKKTDFVGYNTPKKCCLDNTTLGSFITDKEALACDSKKDEKNMAVFKDYILNTYQDIKNKNGLDFTDKTLAKQACFAECVFNNSNLISFGSLHISGIYTLFTRNTSQNWTNTIAKIVSTCEGYVNNAYVPRNLTTSDKPVKTCSILPLMAAQCVRYFMIGACNENMEPKTKIPAICAEGTNAQENCYQPFFPNGTDIIWAMKAARAAKKSKLG